MSLMRSFFIALSHSQSIRSFSEHSAIGRRMSARFVAGMELDDAMRVAEALNRQGILVTLDSLGESVTQPEEARRAAQVYHQLLDRIAERKLKANVSVKLTQMGLTIDPALAESIAVALTEQASRTGSFVRIDMEDSSLTQTTIDIVRHVHAMPGLGGSIGIVIQAYLHRSLGDIELLNQEQIRVRLCKGAYQEPGTVAFPRKSDVDDNYIRLACLLLGGSEAYHGIATHDEQMIAAVKSYAAQHAIPAARFEFQMLYGVRRDLQLRLVREGYNVRVYVPFGTEWYPYFMRRLAERPANVLFLAKNFFRR
jgi:proline dehydrogenase